MRAEEIRLPIFDHLSSGLMMPATWGQLQQFVSQNEANLVSEPYLRISLDGEWRIDILLGLIERLLVSATGLRTHLVAGAGLSQGVLREYEQSVHLIWCSTIEEAEQASRPMAEFPRIIFDELARSTTVIKAIVVDGLVRRIQLLVPHMFLDEGARIPLVKALINGAEPGISPGELSSQQQASSASDVAIEYYVDLLQNQEPLVVDSARASVQELLIHGGVPAVERLAQRVRCSRSAVLFHLIWTSLERISGVRIESAGVDFSNRRGALTDHIGSIVQPVYVQRSLTSTDLQSAMLHSFRHGMYDPIVLREMVGWQLPRVYFNDMVHWAEPEKPVRASNASLNRCNGKDFSRSWGDALQNDWYSVFYAWASRHGHSSTLRLKLRSVGAILDSDGLGVLGKTIAKQLLAD